VVNKDVHLLEVSPLQHWSMHYRVTVWLLRLRRRTVKFCSVVFDVTLTFLVINTSSSSGVNSKRRRLPATSVTRLPRSGAAVCRTFSGRALDNTQWSQMLVENRDSCLSHLHSTPSLIRREGVPSEYWDSVWYGKTRMVWLAIRWWNNFEYSFIRFDRIHERDGRTDGQTDGQTSHDGVDRAYE